MDTPLMNRRLTDAEVTYVFDNLRQFVKTDARIETIVEWPRTSVPICEDFAIDGIPILCPNEVRSPEVYGVEGDKVIVRHDLVRSAFVLLSGWQEWATDKRDKWGRFPYAGSLQEKLGVVRKPIVNYYFEWMVDAICRQCEILGVACERVGPLGGASLHLSHDIDLARYYTWRKSLFRVAQVVGLRRCDTSRARMAKAALRSLLNMARPRHDDDPYWSFDTIQDNEAYIGFKSDWFFLPNDGGPFPPDYDLSTDEDIRSVMAQLARRGNRVGPHAPINCKDAVGYAAALKSVVDACPGAVHNVRQHFLAIEPRQSYRAMADAGLEVDFSYGYSEHEGFRNSYCLPFHPFDHEAQRPLPLTVVPLALMDVTVLAHRALSFDDIFLSVGEMLDEVRRFGGVFSMLWHNSTFDETYYPGVGKFYEDLHLLFSQYQMRDFTARG